MRGFVIVALVSALMLTGCNGNCVREIRVKPNISVIGGQVVGSGDVAFKFAQCLTNEEQKIAERIKLALAEALERVARGELSPDQYNQFINQAHEALRKVVYVLEAEGGAGFGGDPRESAFAGVESTAAQIEAAVGASNNESGPGFKG